MEENEKISLIVPVYNVEKYLEKCVNSILKQTYKNLEIILVDDGSTDESAEICDKLKKDDNRIVVVHKTNGGLSDARNVGIGIATGNYLGFIDSDDYIQKDMYEYLYKLIKENNADISICNYMTIYEDKDFQVEKIPNEIQAYTKIDAMRELLKRNQIQDYAWNKLYKRNLFNNIKYPVGRKMEDLGTTYKLFDKADKIIIGNQKKYFYLQRMGSIVNNKTIDLFIDKYELTLERYNYLKSKYGELIENEIDMLQKILELYQIKDITVCKYIEEKKINKFLENILNQKNVKKNLTLKLRIKLILLKYSKKIYRIIFGR